MHHLSQLYKQSSQYWIINRSQLPELIKKKEKNNQTAMDKIIQNLLEMKLYRGPFHIDSGDSHLIPIYEETHTLKQEVDFVKPYDKWIKTKQYGANDPCEDTLEYRRLDSINAYTVSIFDGHGGPQLSQYSKENVNKFMNNFIEQQLSDDSNESYIVQLLEDALKWAYEQIENTFLKINKQQIESKMKYVGTCGITAVFYKDNVILGNAGDSQAIFITQKGTDDKFEYFTANERLTANNKNQRKRLLQQFQQDDIVVERAPNCYYLKGRLQPTRTIGDYYLKQQHYYSGQGKYNGPYLSCKPDVKVYKLTEEHKYMVIASDGIWDYLKKSQVVESLTSKLQADADTNCSQSSNSSQLMQFAEQLVHQTLKKCANLSDKSLQQLEALALGCRRDYHDDITIAVIDLAQLD